MVAVVFQGGKKIKVITDEQYLSTKTFGFKFENIDRSKEHINY